MEKLKIVSMADKDVYGRESKWQKAGLKHGEYFISKESFVCGCCFRKGNIWRIVGYPGGHPELQCLLEQSKEILEMADNVLFRKNAKRLREFIESAVQR